MNSTGPTFQFCTLVRQTPLKASGCAQGAHKVTAEYINLMLWIK